MSNLEKVQAHIETCDGCELSMMDLIELAEKEESLER